MSLFWTQSGEMVADGMLGAIIIAYASVQSDLGLR